MQNTRTEDPAENAATMKKFRGATGAVFLSCFIFLFYLIINNFTDGIFAFVLTLLIGVSSLLLFSFFYDVLYLVISLLLFSLIYPLEYCSTIYLHLCLLSLSLFLLPKIKINLEKIKQGLVYGIGAYVLLLVFSISINLVLTFLGWNDAGAVMEILDSLPLYILLFAIFFAPISEEFLFRRLLTPKIGIILSSIVFSLFHFSYGSIAELFGTFGLGLVLAWIYMRKKNILIPIIAHLLFNLTSILLARVVFA